MFRSALCLLVGLSFIAATVSAPAPPKAPSTDEIKKAIENLGNKRFEVRKNAQKLLFEAGEAAEPLLNEAVNNPDAEIANAAKSILEKFQWGLYHDTPKEIRENIEQFRSGDNDDRVVAIGRLFEIRPVPFATIRKLTAKEEDAALRGQMFSLIYRQAISEMPELLESGKKNLAEAMLEFIALNAPETAASSYAALIYLRGKTDGAIARFEKQRRQKGEDTKHIAVILVHLYRNKGDFPKARQAAIDSGNDELIDRALWQASDWKGLFERSKGNLGAEAAYARLAGNQKAFAEKIEEIRKTAHDVADNDDATLLRPSAVALMLNDKGQEAVELLLGKKKDTYAAFDLLCTQLKFKEALELDGGPDDLSFELRRARMLYLLGEKDRALQLFRKVSAGSLKNSGAEYELIWTHSHLNLRDLAFEHAAAALAPFDRNVHIQQGLEILKALYNDDTASAWSWLSVFKNEKPEVALRQVASILAGKFERKKMIELAGKMLTMHKQEAEPDLYFERADAVAAAYKAIGDTAKAGEYLKLAAEQRPTSQRCLAYGDFLISEKKYRGAERAYASAVTAGTGPGQSIFGRPLIGTSCAPEWGAYLRGRALMLAGDAKESQRLFELAHWLSLGDVGRVGLFKRLKAIDLPEQAEKELEMHLKTGWHSNNDGMLNDLAGEAYWKKEYLKAADLSERHQVDLLRNGINYIDFDFYLRLAEKTGSYRTLGQLAEGKIDAALKEANASLDWLPGNLILANSMVPDLDKLHKKKEADAIYRRVRGAWQKVLDDYPGSGMAHNNLAWLMVNCGRDLDTALKHATKAAEVDPNRVPYLDTLAEVRFRLGQRDAALALIKKCLEREPNRLYFRKQLARFKDQPFDSVTPNEFE